MQAIRGSPQGAAKEAMEQNDMTLMIAGIDELIEHVSVLLTDYDPTDKVKLKTARIAVNNYLIASATAVQHEAALQMSDLLDRLEKVEWHKSDVVLYEIMKLCIDITRGVKTGNWPDRFNPPRHILSKDDILEIESQVELIRDLMDFIDCADLHNIHVTISLCEKVLDYPGISNAMYESACRLVVLLQTGCNGDVQIRDLMDDIRTAASHIEDALAEMINENAASTGVASGEALIEEIKVVEVEKEIEAAVQELYAGADPALIAHNIVPASNITRKPPAVTFDPANPELCDFISETREYLENAEAALVALEMDPGCKGLVNEIFRFMHNIKGISGFLQLHDVQAIAHTAESLLSKARDGAVELRGTVAEACFETIDLISKIVDKVKLTVETHVVYKTPSNYMKVLEKLEGLLVEIETPSLPDKEKIMPTSVADTIVTNLDDTAKSPVESFDEAGISAVDAEMADTVKEQKVSATEQQGGKNRMATMLKVNVSRLDSLIDAVGELVIANAMIMRQNAILMQKIQEKDVLEEGEEDAEIFRMMQSTNQLDTITRDLQELAMGMRMVSLQSVFQKMARVARDISAKSSTPVQFLFSGEDTEIDRNVVEEITSPLVHMVRNAVDHGIESVEERKKAGKNEIGHVHLSASHEGGNVVIRLQDDGAGLNTRKIFDKAVKLGMIGPDDDLSPREIHNLIFQPGFSTAAQVTDVSGRGVGMDVVKRSIENLRGKVEIHTEPGEGTEFVIRLPLTLAIIDGMEVVAGGESYFIPTIAIQESLRPAASDIVTVTTRGEMISVRGSLVPLVRLNRLLNIKNAKEDPCDALVLIMGESGDSDNFAVMVDDLIGQQQVVIKNLGKVVGRPLGITGGAIMGDGQVALILDPAGLLKLADTMEMA